ncbi:MAG TPA: alpha/beta hydrolase [Stellaceae bacterium]|nr:alpha/beta hydrolase [Stellaceae bacterium]
MDGLDGEAHRGEETGGMIAAGEGVSIAYRRRIGKPGLAGVVFMGGFRSDMTGTKATALDRFCAARGQSYLRFDYRGHGASGGRFEDATMGDWLADSLAVLDRLTEGPQILVGSSMGGWIALLTALARKERVAGLVLVAAAPDFTEALVWERLPADARDELMAAGSLTVPSEYAPEGYRLSRRLIEEGRAHLLLDRPIPLDIPARLLHGMRDADVPWPHSLRAVEALAGTDVRLTLVKDGDHRLSTPDGLRLMTGAVAELSDGAGR